MKHDIYKLAEQYHLNESEQQMFQSLLEAADQNTVQRKGVCSTELRFAGSTDPSE